jgi:hypothetical protein
MRVLHYALRPLAAINRVKGQQRLKRCFSRATGVIHVGANVGQERDDYAQ